MNDQLDFLHLIADRLESAGIPYMLTGSVAMSVFVQPRMTRDIDLVVECNSVTPTDWVNLFQADCYVSESAVEEAMVGAGMFNIIHLEGIAKADFIVRKDDEFRKTEFERRILRKIGGREVFVVTPEDLFLSKLLWWKESDSSLQKSDLILLKESVDDLDVDYIEKWASKLNALDYLEKLKT